MAVASADVFTELGPDAKTSVPPEGKVELSFVERGCAESVPQTVMALKYVAQGTELYHYGGRTFRVPANSFLVLPEGHSGEASLDRRDGTAVGMCVYMPAHEQNACKQAQKLDVPIVFPARSSVLGQSLAQAHRDMIEHPFTRPVKARALISSLERDLESFLAEATATIALFENVKPSTRLEHLRRLNVARRHLHDVLDRSVSLAELARECGMSRFHLVRLFSAAFGASPASYHRSIRLQAAHADLQSGQSSCLEVAHRYGFADNAHFSRSFKQQFGVPPSRAA